jgi:hypothetical protein
MSIYVNKNGQQLGPFEEAQVAEMLRSGQLSPNDSGFKQGQQKWLPLSEIFPNAGTASSKPSLPISPAKSSLPIPQNNKPPMKKRTLGGIYVSSVVLMVLGLVFGGILILFGADRTWPAGMIGGVALASIGYLQFMVAHIVIMFYILYRMWDSIQDGVSTSTGKAIGYLFIPVFSVYWVFKAWNGFPTEYNQYLERHQLNVSPINSSVYLMVPIFILLSVFILPFLALPFIFMSLISRASDDVNQLRQGLENKVAGHNTKIEAPKETLLSPLMRAAALGLVAISIFSLIGTAGLVWWSLNPKPGPNDLPETVGNFSKTQNLMSKGSFTGGSQQFGALYETADKKKAIAYDVRTVAAENEKKVYPNGSAKPSDVMDANGNKVGEYIIQNGHLDFFNGSQKFLIWDLNSSSPSYMVPPELDKKGKITSLTDSEMLEFAKALPVNSQIKFAGANPASTPVPTSSPSPASSTTPTSSNTETRNPAAGDTADFTFTAEDFYALAKKKESSTYIGKTIEITGRAEPLGSSLQLKANLYNSVDISFAAGQNTASIKEDDRLKLKCVGVEKYGSLDLGNCLIVENKGIISADDKPDFTVTAADYYKQSLDVNHKYRNKIVDVTGKVKVIGGKGEHLVAEEYLWVTCYPLPGAENQFTGLKDGAEVKFRGIGDIGGLKNCIVISK